MYGISLLALVIILYVEIKHLATGLRLQETRILIWKQRIEEIQEQIKVNESDETETIEKFVSLFNPSKSEVRHIGFLKVHKAASSTVQNILYRFGLKRNLSFVLPMTSHYLATTKYSYNAVLPPLQKDNGKYDILCNHARFNLAKFRTYLVKDAVYIAIVRDPFEQFLSAAYYFKFVWSVSYLDKLDKTSFIHDLILDAEKHEPADLTHSFTFNSMANDFGYELTSIKAALSTTDEQIEDFVLHISNTFHYVLVMERFEESLVLLKRLLHWQLQDVLFIDLNRYWSKGESANMRSSVDVDNKQLFRERNRVDYKVYEYFYHQFEEKIAQEYRFSDEVNHFRSMLKAVQAFCKLNKSKVLHVNSSEWNSKFVVDTNDCTLMATQELSMFKLMTEKHLELLNASQAELSATVHRIDPT